MLKAVSDRELALPRHAQLRRRFETLAPQVPADIQLDFHNDKTYLSVVGFLFYHAKPRRALQ